jgi:RimJ/RimL family protein N-acetyltransferase
MHFLRECSVYTVRILEPADQPALEAFCLPRIATSMFLLSNSRAAGLVDRGERYQGTYAGAFLDLTDGEGPKCVGVVAHCWNKMLIPQAPDHLDELWRAAVRASGRPIGGALGPADQVGAMVEAWRAEGWSVEMRLDQQEKLYVLPLEELRVPEALRTGQLRGRRITAADVDQVVCWTVAFDVESLHEEDGPRERQSARASVEHKLEDGHLWVVEARTAAGDLPVAVSGLNAALREAVQIGPVYTPPELRCRGYARAVVAASLLDVRAQGVHTAILFTGEDNLPAQKAYAALGFRHVGMFRLVLLKTPIADEGRRTTDDE